MNDRIDLSLGTYYRASDASDAGVIIATQCRAEYLTLGPYVVRNGPRRAVDRRRRAGLPAKVENGDEFYFTDAADVEVRTKLTAYMKGVGPAPPTLMPSMRVSVAYWARNLWEDLSSGLLGDYDPTLLDAARRDPEVWTLVAGAIRNARSRVERPLGIEYRRSLIGVTDADNRAFHEAAFEGLKQLATLNVLVANLAAAGARINSLSRDAIAGDIGMEYAPAWACLVLSMTGEPDELAHTVLARSADTARVAESLGTAIGSWAEHQLSLRVPLDEVMETLVRCERAMRRSLANHVDGHSDTTVPNRVLSAALNVIGPAVAEHMLYAPTVSGNLTTLIYEAPGAVLVLGEWLALKSAADLVAAAGPPNPTGRATWDSATLSAWEQRHRVDLAEGADGTVANGRPFESLMSLWFARLERAVDVLCQAGAYPGREAFRAFVQATDRILSQKRRWRRDGIFKPRPQVHRAAAHAAIVRGRGWLGGKHAGFPLGHLLHVVGWPSHLVIPVEVDHPAESLVCLIVELDPTKRFATVLPGTIPIPLGQFTTDLSGWFKDLGTASSVQPFAVDEKALALHAVTAVQDIQATPPVVRDAVQ